MIHLIADNPSFHVIFSLLVSSTIVGYSNSYTSQCNFDILAVTSGSKPNLFSSIDICEIISCKSFVTSFDISKI